MFFVINTYIIYAYSNSMLKYLLFYKIKVFLCSGYGQRMYGQNSNHGSHDFPSRLVQNGQNENFNFNSNKYSQNDYGNIKNGLLNFHHDKGNSKLDHFSDLSGGGSLTRPKK